jgi:hypothetical protein
MKMFQCFDTEKNVQGTYNTSLMFDLQTLSFGLGEGGHLKSSDFDP